MKLNHLTSTAHFFRRGSTRALMLGGFAVAVQVACSDAPSTPSTPLPGASGSTNNTAGTPANTAGTPAMTAGTFSMTAGSAGTFSTAGTTDVGGSTAGGMGGTGGTTAGTTSAGTGGTPVQPTAFCMDQTPQTLPYTVNKNYHESGWSVGPPAISNPTDLAFNACTKRVAGAVGDCTKWRYTPQTIPAPVWVIWEVPKDAPKNHVCLPDGVNSIAFCARGVQGGEKIMAGGAGKPEADITLTAEWKVFTVPLAGVDYNTFDNGVPTGFVWKIVPPAPAVITEFFIDKIQFVKDAPAADYCADSGAGGAGGAGG